MAWYWWAALGLAAWVVLPGVLLGPTLGKLLARRAEEQLTPLPQVPPDQMGEALTKRLEEIIAEHAQRRKRRREPTE